MLLPSGQGQPIDLPASARARAVAAGRQPAFLADVRLRGSHLRVITAPYGPGFALQVARSMEEVDGALNRLRLILLAAALAGVGLAAGLGTAVAPHRPHHSEAADRDNRAGQPDP